MALSTRDVSMIADSSQTEGPDRLVARALAVEREPDRWEDRFRRLLAAGIVRAPDYDPGAGCPPTVIRGPVDLRVAGGVRDQARRREVYVLLNERTLEAVQQGDKIGLPGPDAARTRRVDARNWWRELMDWMATTPEASLAMAGLADESPPRAKGAVIDPLLGRVTRPEAAAVVLHVDVARLVSDDGQVSVGGIRQHLRDAVRLADDLIGVIGWPTPAHRRDAATRRRVCLNLAGLFDAMERLGVDPRCYRGLCKLRELLGEICTSALAASAQLARERGPCRGAAAGAFGRDGHPFARPRVRHAQLTCVSPFEFLPPDRNAARAYIDLLPVIGLPDSVSWRRPRAAPRLHADELAALYRLTWATRRIA